MVQHVSTRTRRYFDNAATSFPKPPEVTQAMVSYATNLGASPGRGAYDEVAATARILTSCRERLSSLLGGPGVDHVVFTLNATDALNLAIVGIVTQRLAEGRRAHLVTSDLEHNSILRPFRLLAERHPGHVTVTRIRCDARTGLLTPEDVLSALGSDTALVALAHGSNAAGTLQPIEEIGPICRAAKVPFLVDGAQTVGHCPLDMDMAMVDLLAVPGHKGLLGPLGTGALLMREGMEELIAPIRVGGTGSASESDSHPVSMPDRYEAGSHNAIGIVGLDAALGWIEEQGLEQLIAHETELSGHLLEGLLANNDLRVLGPRDITKRCSVFSIVHNRIDSTELARRLEQDHGILVRAGLHCAPFAHQNFGTDPRTASANGMEPGACRLSLGPFLDRPDVDAVLDALRSLRPVRIREHSEGVVTA